MEAPEIVYIIMFNRENTSKETLIGIILYVGFVLIWEQCIIVCRSLYIQCYFSNGRKRQLVCCMYDFYGGFTPLFL